jgi:hypothetical protein
VNGEVSNGGITAIFDKDNFETVYTTEFFFGPVFELLNRTNLSLPLAIGFHILTTNAKVDLPTTVFSGYFSSLEYNGTQFGIASTFGARFIFNNGFYFVPRLKLAIDFGGKIEPEYKSNTYAMYPTDTSRIVSIAAFLGVGYQFGKQNI